MTAVLGEIYYFKWRATVCTTTGDYHCIRRQQLCFQKFVAGSVQFGRSKAACEARMRQGHRQQAASGHNLVQFGDTPHPLPLNPPLSKSNRKEPILLLFWCGEILKRICWKGGAFNSKSKRERERETVSQAERKGKKKQTDTSKPISLSLSLLVFLPINQLEPNRTLLPPQTKAPGLFDLYQQRRRDGMGLIAQQPFCRRVPIHTDAGERERTEEEGGGFTKSQKRPLYSPYSTYLKKVGKKPCLMATTLIVGTVKSCVLVKTSRLKTYKISFHKIRI